MPLIFLAIIIMGLYAEFLVFAGVAGEIGGLSAILLTISTAFLGIYIIRQEGIQVLSNIRNTMEKGESPVTELVQGFLLAIAGFFFLLPGFITDAIAIFLAISPLRAMLSNMMVKTNLQNSTNRPHTSHSEGIIIDGEFEESDEQDLTKNQKIIDENDEHGDEQKM